MVEIWLITLVTTHCCAAAFQSLSQFFAVHLVGFECCFADKIMRKHLNYSKKCIIIEKSCFGFQPFLTLLCVVVVHACQKGKIYVAWLVVVMVENSGKTSVRKVTQRRKCSMYKL